MDQMDVDLLMADGNASKDGEPASTLLRYAEACRPVLLFVQFHRCISFSFRTATSSITSSVIRCSCCCFDPGGRDRQEDR